MRWDMSLFLAPIHTLPLWCIRVKRELLWCRTTSQNTTSCLLSKEWLVMVSWCGKFREHCHYLIVLDEEGPFHRSYLQWCIYCFCYSCTHTLPHPKSSHVALFMYTCMVLTLSRTCLSIVHTTYSLLGTYQPNSVPDISAPHYTWLICLLEMNAMLGCMDTLSEV